MIAPWQGFWVKANGENPVLSVTDDVMGSGGMFMKKTLPASLGFTLEGDNNRKSSTKLMLHEKAAAGKDPFDAYKLQPLSEDFLSVFTALDDGTALDINVLPFNLTEMKIVDLGISGTDLTGEFTLSWNPQVLPDNWSFELQDTYTSEMYDLSVPGDLVFELGPAQTEKKQTVKQPSLPFPQHHIIPPNVMKTTGIGSTRFSIHISPGAVTSTGHDELPTELELDQNYPNPFNPSTVISYQLPESSSVLLEVYDILGKRIAILVDDQVAAGRHTVTFDAGMLSSGLYVYRLIAGQEVKSKTMILVK